MKHLLIVSTIVAAFGQVGPAIAQTAKNGTIAGNGTAEIKRQPQFLRVQIDVLAKGKDIKEALGKLKERREVIKLQLGKLEAVTETVAFGEPALGSEKTNQQRQMEMMIGQRLRSLGKTPAKNKQPSVAVSFTLKFDVPLKAASAEELLIAADQLQTKIKDADLAGLKEFEKLTPQEEEQAEEAKMAEMMGGQQEGPKTGEPSFFFISKVTDAEMAKALADAFQKAHQEADQLAKAAGAELGPLHHLETQNLGPAGDDEGYSGRYNPYYARMQMATAIAQQREAVGVRAGSVTYRIGVAAQFQVKAK